MKKICLLTALICLCLCSVATAWAEVIDFGDICLFLKPATSWELPSGDILQVGVLSYGSGHFALHGKTSSFPGRSSEILHGPVHGTAMIDGSNIVLSVTITSFPDPQIISGSFSQLHIILNGVTLSGPYLEMRSGGAPGSQLDGFASVIECT